MNQANNSTENVFEHLDVYHEAHLAILSKYVHYEQNNATKKS